MSQDINITQMMEVIKNKEKCIIAIPFNNFEMDLYKVVMILSESCIDYKRMNQFEIVINKKTTLYFTNTNIYQHKYIFNINRG
jgi:hypothetical protein